MNREYKIHAFYILIVLFAVIIGLITTKWGEITRLVELINFASTVTSLVLAVLAIVYAFLSNSSVAQSMTNLNNASSEISNSANDVSEAAKELKGKIEAIPTRLESMEDSFDELKLLFQSTETQEIRPPSKEEKEATSEIADLFINRLPISSLIVIYAFFLAYRNNLPINFRELFSNIKSFSSYYYATGLFVGMISSGLLSHQKESNTVSVITSFNEKLSEQIENEFNKIVDKAFEKYSKRMGTESASRVRAKFDSDIESISLYFSV